MASLFDIIQLGDINLQNRIAMGLLARMWSKSDNMIYLLNTEYYAQCASAGVFSHSGDSLFSQDIV